MKKRVIKNVLTFIVLVTLVIIILELFTENETETSTNFESYINDILEPSDADTREIYNVLTKDLSGVSAEGGYIKAVYDGMNIRYMLVNVFFEMGRSQKEYHFHENLIEITNIDILYDEPFYIDPLNISINDIKTTNYIITNGKLYILGEQEKDLIEENSGKLEEEIDNIKEYINIINT